MENTRRAYTSAAKLRVAYAECDVWATRDGHMVLCHDSSFASMAADPAEPRASSPISSLSWDEVRDVELKDGSRPVLLSTVLQDVAGSSTKLVVELKSSDPAAPLAEFLAEHPELLASVGFVLSFSLSALEVFTAALSLVFEAARPMVVWLTDNPSAPYGDDVNEGETTFDYTSESLGAFLARNALIERVKRLQCGLYLQYNPLLDSEQLRAVRSELTAMCGDVGAITQSFLGIWSDASLDPAFDTVTNISQLLPLVDAVNTDLPDSFWN